LPACKKDECDCCSCRAHPHYVVIDKHGHGTLPIRVNAVDDGIYDIYDHDTHEDQTADPKYSPQSALVHLPLWNTIQSTSSYTQHTYENADYTDDISMPSQMLARSTMGGESIIVRDKKIILPKKYKAFQLGKSSPLFLASINDIEHLVFDTYKKVQVYKNTKDTYAIDNQKSAAYNDALKSLVYDYHFRENDARDILKASNEKGLWNALTVPYVPPRKKADNFDPREEGLGSGYVPPVFMPPSVSRDDYSGVAIQEPVNDRQQLGIQSDPLPSDFTMDFPPPMAPDETAIQNAQQAAANGDKNVFSVSALVGILNKNPDDIVTQYNKVFKQAMDRLFRLKFKMLWNYEDFIEKYGDDKMEDFEDSISTCASQLGDIVLFVEDKDDRPALEDLLSGANTR
jgi:hypothetical protein